MNRLGAATSPYLLQHKENPVDWWEWSDEAFEEARRRDVPILLSVGYAACHWCHVMAHESFEDPAVAAYVNERFVAVKVDREERPDIDAVYMAATQALTGQGGWPMTVFLTADGEPFYAGTYFPPRPMRGSPSFMQVLTTLHEAWTTQRGEVTDAAGRITAALRERTRPVDPRELDPERVDTALAAAIDELAASCDVARGGFGGAPKFPPSMVIEALLRQHALTGDPRALGMAQGTCEAMARGGIYDQLDGGFARYSVDATWVIPHFEKMLYDNALLLSAYTSLWLATGDPLAERVVSGTAGFLLERLRTPEGGFASALDADTEGVEGATYVWTPAQLVEALGEADGRWAAALLSVTEQGTFEHGTSVLQRRTDPDDETRWQRVCAGLLAVRDARPQPGLDDKVVTAWNGLAIAALARAGVVFGAPEWVAAAVSAAELLLAVHVDAAGGVRRVSRHGVAGDAAGLLEDHAGLAGGLLALHQATGDARWLASALPLLDRILTAFRDERTGALHDTAHDAPELVLRLTGPDDNATPSGASSAADALLTAAALTGSDRYREAAEGILGGLIGALPARFAGQALATAAAWRDGPREVAVVGPPGPARDDLVAVAVASTAPGRVVSVGTPDAAGIPLLAGRTLVDGEPTAYVCRHMVCDRPTIDPTVLRTQLGTPSR